MGTDKSRIWDDCASCAYKHLTAAYAALTSADAPAGRMPQDWEIYLEDWEIYLARAEIAVEEAKRGYRGNLDLAAGCLAAAEPLAPNIVASALRDRRLRLVNGDLSEDGVLPAPRLDAVAFAHITEAFRELPELKDRYLLSMFDPRTSEGPGADEQSVLTTLIDAIKWLSGTFELGSARGGDRV